MRVKKALKMSLLFLKPSLLFLLVILFGFFLFAFFSAGEIYEYKDTVDGVHLPKVDVIVCLAGGRGRITQASDLWYRYYELSQMPMRGAGRSPVPPSVPMLYLSGVGHRLHWSALTQQFRRGLLQALKPSYVIFERESTNTEENALWFARYAKERGWERVLLVTSSYHMKRAKALFEAILNHDNLKVKIHTLSVYQEPFEPQEWRTSLHGIHITLQEYIKWLHFKWTKAF